MHPFADPYALTSHRTLTPGIAKKMVEAIADAICIPWRKDARCGDSIGTHYDQQTNQRVKDQPTTENFTRWHFERDAGLIRGLNICWGETAVTRSTYVMGMKRNSKMRTSGPLAFNRPDRDVAIFVTVTLDPTRVAVDGDMNKKGTSQHRLLQDIYTAVFDTVGGVADIKVTMSPP